MSTHLVRLASAGMVLAAALSACAEESVQGIRDPLRPVDVEYVGDGPSRLFPDGSAPIRLTLRDGEISFVSSCNQFSGQASWDDGVLRTGPLGGTEMGCPGLRQRQDAWMVDFFGSSPRLALNGTDLSLRSGGDRVWFVPADELPSAEPGDTDDLRGTRWRLTGISERDGDSIGVMVIPDDAGAAIRFEGDEISVHTGCNTGSGRAVVEGEEIRIGPIRVHVPATLLPCTGAAAEVERGMLRVLAGTVAWSVTRDELRLGARDGAHELVFHR